MTGYVALLRAVNVGGRKLAMTDLKAIAERLGLGRPRTFIASGNLLFASAKDETAVKAALEDALRKHMGVEVPVMVRTADEMAAAAKANPFRDAPGNRVSVIFFDSAPPEDAVEKARNVADDEHIVLGRREIYVAWGRSGMGRSRLVIPAAKNGTARNMNTVAKLAELAREME